MLVMANYRNEDGEVRQTASLTDTSTAETTEDGGGTVTRGRAGTAVWEWIDIDLLQLTITDIDVPSAGTISVQVLVQETPDGEFFQFQYSD